MKEIYNPDRHHRRSIRLRGYDYSRAGAYFLTICTHQQTMLFGEIIDGEMALNELGHIVEQEWAESERIRAEIQLDEWVVMPNHFHGIVWISRDVEIDAQHFGRGDRPVAPTSTSVNHPAQLDIPTSTPVVPTGPKSKSIGALVAGFKSAVTKSINTIRRTPGSPVWQRNYYEHVIRDEAALNRIRQYIIENPALWDKDMYNPVRQQHP